MSCQTHVIGEATRSIFTDQSHNYIEQSVFYSVWVFLNKYTTIFVKKTTHIIASF